MPGLPCCLRKITNPIALPLLLPWTHIFSFLATMGGRGTGIRRSPLFNRFYVHQTLEYGRSIRWRLSHNSVFFSFHSSTNCIELYLCSSLCSHLSTVMNTEGTAQKTLIALYGLFAQIYIFAQITNCTALCGVVALLLVTCIAAHCTIAKWGVRGWWVGW